VAAYAAHAAQKGSVAANPGTPVAAGTLVVAASVVATPVVATPVVATAGVGSPVAETLLRGRLGASAGGTDVVGADDGRVLLHADSASRISGRHDNRLDATT